MTYFRLISFPNESKLESNLDVTKSDITIEKQSKSDEFEIEYE